MLKPGDDGKALIKLKGKGPDVDVPTLAALASPVVVELRQTSDDACGSTTFSAPFRVQKETAFVDVSD